jgi:hypothetical protein
MSATGPEPEAWLPQFMAAGGRADDPVLADPLNNRRRLCISSLFARVSFLWRLRWPRRPRMGAMGGDRCAGHRAAHARSGRPCASNWRPPVQQLAGEALGVANDDGRSRHGTTARRYATQLLPANWTQVSNALSGHGAGGYSALSADVQRHCIAANAVLSPQRMATLSPRVSAADSKRAPVERHAAGSDA